ncbi:hypothetical protein P691DRAFT_810746 [Macrolepiota fuliginosa MF-IS2]|uniref:Dioxygenase n=1 Tax=Macrolepiota fuliginosa MF-IS2 TaxID=1400762 RepID=A0A9P5X3U9_9AGAR|nr:hypothetical protein P691DRAFT_810746 [Macrolepiota fuliginosa MF-IS2]
MSTTPKPSWAAPGLENAQVQHEPILLPVKGQIPSWLAGSLYRTGPGTFRIKPTSTPNDSKSRPEVNMSHWFDGLGMNHLFRITPNGDVYYSNRLSTDSRAARIQQLGHVPGITFGKQEDPCGTLFKKFFTFFLPQSKPKSEGIPFKDRPDIENISVTLSPNLPGLSSHNAAKEPTSGLRYLVAKTDANMLQVLDPDTLKPLEITSYARLDPRLEGQISAAHSCVDPATGEFFNYVQQFGPKPRYKVFRATPAKESGEKVKVDILAEITDAPMAYLHSFVLTKKYVVLCIWQSDYSLFVPSLPESHGCLTTFYPGTVPQFS